MSNKHLIPYYTTMLSLSPRDMQRFVDIMDEPLPYVIRVSKSTPYYDDAVDMVVKMGFRRMCDNVYEWVERGGMKNEMGERNVIGAGEKSRRSVEDGREGEQREGEKEVGTEKELNLEKEGEGAQSRKKAKKNAQQCAANHISDGTSAQNDEIALIKKYLTILTDLNIITRQELVSILPSSFIVTLKNRRTSMHVLDLCAAPGSKSTHLLENGVTLTANDSNLKRCFIVQHRSAHMPKLLTNTNGLNFPRPVVPYDAVLVDAPCSGDGTFRKNKVKVFSKNVRLMRALVMKAMSMVDGGYVVYSTCAVDPVENEWVVQSLRDVCTVVGVDEVGNDMFEMVRMNCGNEERNGNDEGDGNDEGNGNEERNGNEEGDNERNINDNKNGNSNRIENENEKGNRNENGRYVNGKYKIFYREGLTEWTTDTEYKSENYEELKKCMRFYPQDNNSGAFFIAILRRRGTKAGSEGNSGTDGGAHRNGGASGSAPTIPIHVPDTVRTIPASDAVPNISELTINKVKYSSANPALVHSLLSQYHLSLKGQFITTANNNRIYYLDNDTHLIVAKKTNVVSIGILLFTKVRDDQYRINNLWYFGKYVEECCAVDERVFRRMIDGERVDEVRFKGFGVVRHGQCYYCVCAGRERIDVYVKEKEKEVIRVIMGDEMVL